MAATAGQMNLNNTARADYATAMATGQMVLNVVSTTGMMQASEPATVTGLMVTSSHDTAGLMTLIINS